MAEWYSIIHTYVFLIYPLINTLVDPISWCCECCFNKRGVWIFFSYIDFSSLMQILHCGIAGPHGTSVLIFWVPSILVFIMAVQMTLPPTILQCSLNTNSSPAWVVSYCLGSKKPHFSKVISNYCFDSLFLFFFKWMLPLVYNIWEN